MNHNHASMKPVIFWLLITSSTLPDNINGRCDHEEDLYNAGIVLHKFTGLSGQRSRACVDTIPNWRHKFPRLEQLQLTGDLNCDAIHMEVSLNLMSAHPPEGAELYTRTELSIPGRKSDDRKLQWRIATSLTKPPELCRDSSLDPPLDGEELIVDVLSSNEAETRIKLPFPAMAWAHAFTCLVNIQSRCEERRKAAQYGLDSSEALKSGRECVDQLSMYQEVRSSPNPKGPFTRRAAILWTFRKAREGEASGTNWRYIDALPPRRTVMSQSPHASHRVSAAMNENFNSWVDPSMQLQHPNMLNSFVQGLATPPHTTGLNSPYATQGFAYSGLPFDLAGEELSFVSSNTVDSESTFVDGDSTASGLDNFLNGNHGLQLGEFEQQSNGWQFPHTASFDADPAWATYGVQSTTRQISWEPDIKTSPWSEAPDCKVMAWVDETTLKHDWAEASNSPTKQHSYVEQNIEQKLLPWIEH
jgi:transcriptional enhancer factor